MSMSIARCIAHFTGPATTKSFRLPSPSSLNATRSYTTTPPQQPASDKQRSNNTLLLLAAGTAAAAGGYWYLNNPGDVQQVKEKVKTEEEAVVSKAKGFADASRSRAHDVLAQGKEKYADAKVRFIHLF